MTFLLVCLQVRGGGAVRRLSSSMGPNGVSIAEESVGGVVGMASDASLGDGGLRRQMSFVNPSPAAVEAIEDDEDALEDEDEEEDEDELVASPFAKPDLLTCISEENLFEAEDRGEVTLQTSNMERKTKLF